MFLENYDAFEGRSKQQAVDTGKGPVRVSLEGAVLRPQEIQLRGALGLLRTAVEKRALLQPASDPTEEVQPR